jgi:hypothetical protein
VFHFVFYPEYLIGTMSSSSAEFLALFRKRDLLAFGMILLALYISIDMHGFHYSMEVDWYIDQRKSRHSNIENLPPLVTDLDGNGENELVLITRDHYLKVCGPDLHVFLPEQFVGILPLLRYYQQVRRLIIRLASTPH